MHPVNKLPRTLATLLVLGAPALASAQAQAPAAPIDPKAASYSMGLYFGGQLHSAGLSDSVAYGELERGLKEGLAGKQASDEDRQRMTQWMRSGRDAVATRNRAVAAEFLAANAKTEGVKSTASGLQYTIITAGDANAASPKATDAVIVQFRGHLLDGSVFDSTDAHGGSARFSLNGGVIPGLKEALMMMKPGAQWRVALPPDLAYGDMGRPNIPPGSALVYDLQLEKIEAPKVLEAPKAGAAPARQPAGQAQKPPRH